MLTRATKRKFNALEECRAVLLVWSGRQSASDVCRMLKVSAGLLTMWQEKAMEGLLAALEPREGRAAKAEQGPVLALPLKRLMEKKMADREGLERLNGRLARLNKKTAAVTLATPAPTGG